MIDIHCHILPDLDDGARMLEEALDMAALAVECGVSTIVATPHTNLSGYYSNFECPELEEAFRQFEGALKREGIPLTLVRGAEVYVTSGVVEKVQAGKIRTMNGTKHCLIEFDFDCHPMDIQMASMDFLQAGYVPVIAHPERYYCVQENPLLLARLMQVGAMTQVNKGSVLGRFGRECEACADFLLDEHLVSCIASDAHSAYRRTTEMREISDYLEREYSREYRDELLRVNPGKIIGVKA